MMEGQNGNISPHKTTENGIKGRPPYSVETPYGFRLDLDFLKYVDDIEKGNTIRRVPIQRRSKVPRASTLPRHINASSCGYRPSPWGSTGALAPRSRPSDTHHHGYTSWACDHRSPLSPTGLKTLAEMEARMKEFDEQPLGEHIRPHLLRASSLPLTTLLRQGSESTDDPGSLRNSRDHLGGRNISCEDVFYSLESPRPQDSSGLLRRLTEALERVGELEMEVRVIPELRAQICILQEERERLRYGLNAQIYSPSMNGNTDSHTLSHHGTAGVKRPQHESHIMFPIVSQDECNPTHEWRTSTDLDELLTVTSLQAKVAVLEQKLHETGLELQRVLGLLREQQDESKRKDEKIEHIIRNPATWVRAERVVVEQDGDEMLVRSTEPDNSKAASTRSLNTSGGTQTIIRNGQKSRQQDFAVDSTSTKRSSLASVDPGVASAEDTEVVIHHIKKIRSLLEQQWEYLCGDWKSGEDGKPLTHPDPKVNALQQEMMELVNILTSYYTQHGRHSDGDRTQHGATKSVTQQDGCSPTSKNQHSGGVDDGSKITTSRKLHWQDGVNQSKHGDWEQKESSSSPGEMAAAHLNTDSEKSRLEEKRQMSPDRQMISGGTGSGMKPQPPGEHVEVHPGSETTTGGSETVSPDFVAACQFLTDHMDNMKNPNKDMREALVVLFQHWFSAAAEETSVASEVAVYLNGVKKTTPSLLAFLVNLEDDNSNTVLHYSVSHSNYSIVSLLLDTGVSNVDLHNNAGYTAVMLASLTAPDGPGDMEVVRKLMELSNINTRSSQTGQTALHLAVRHGRVVMVRLLLSCGADANVQDNQGTTALMFACERGNTHIARLLLERSQCDLTLTNKLGQTALCIAMQSSHTDTVALLQAYSKT
ncbi:hypothetical protein Q5P01_022144 [Channa striata]|uniref:KN motif and ankyrin repeat domain-containing protein 4 n=1 Tax=Channa striata TaxID=64152 RepID=A0AA88IWJ9_CHASR|nr:hypothetical protein Q5P01_022144 [Channa striata]